MKKQNTIIIMVLGVLAIIALFYFGGRLFSVVGTVDQQDYTYDEKCTTTQDCINFLVSQGMPQGKIEDVTITCENQLCRARWRE